MYYKLSIIIKISCSCLAGIAMGSLNELGSLYGCVPSTWTESSQLPDQTCSSSIKTNSLNHTIYSRRNLTILRPKLFGHVWSDETFLGDSRRPPA